MDDIQKVINFFSLNTEYENNNIKKVKHIKKGFTNECYCVQTDDNKKYLVRFTKNKELNRKVEKLIYDKLNIKLIYFNQEGDLIKPWINGKKIYFWNDLKLTLFANRLKKLNKIESNQIEKFNPYVFFDLLDKQKDKAIINEYQQLVNKHQNDPLCTCHSDLNPNNILFDATKNQVYLIDFEWVKQNNIYWELANFCREKLSQKQMIFLLKEYGLTDYEMFKEYLIMTCLYAYQWTLSVANSNKIIKYRKHIFKRLEKIRMLDFKPLSK